MEDQHSLEQYYDGVLQDVTLHLFQAYEAIEVEHPILNASKHRVVFQVKLLNSGVMIIVGIPYNYPDTFPTVIIPEPIFSKIYPIPHLSEKQVLCTFDDNQAHPNASDPIGVLDAVIERAEDLITKGISKMNDNDYLDEFDSYWEQETGYPYLSLVNFGDQYKEVELIYFSHKTLGESALLADSKAIGEQWLLQVGATLMEKHRRVLYLPIDSIGLPPFPSTNQDILRKLKQQSTHSVQPLLDFLDKYPRPSTIVFSIPGSNGKIIGVWEHGIAEQVITNMYKGKRRVNNVLKGFRPGVRNAYLELVRDFSGLKITKHSIVRVDKERLFHRGGDGTVAEQGRVGIIGCGAIGSQIARSLIEIGIDKLLLIDQDTLTFENIARHVCGATDVGKMKVDAIKQLLTSHFPHCEITSYPEEIISALLSYESILDRCDFSIVAIGSLSTELRINQLLNHRLINKPILFVWVEPFLAGAHAVWIDPDQEGCFECLFDLQHVYLNKVLDNPGQYSKRESGCQSTFVPYGVLEVKRFTNDLLFFIHDILSGSVQRNMVLTWLGNLSDQRKSGRKVSSKWAGADNYSVRIVPVQNISICKECTS